MELKIDREFFAYLPRPTAEQHAAFEEVLREEGVRDPIVVWKGHGIIVDGMTRHPIAVKHNLPFAVLELEFETREDVKMWISRNQAMRRNLAEGVLNYHLGVWYNRAKGAHGGDRTSDAAPENVAEAIAEEAETTPAKVRHAGKFAELVDAAVAVVPELRDALNAGKKVGPAKLKEIAAAGKVEAKRLVKDIAEGKRKTSSSANAAPKASGKPQNLAEDKGDAEDDEKSEPIYDGLGRVVTDVRLFEVMADRAEFETLLKAAKGLEASVNRLSKRAGGVNIHFAESLHSAFKLIKAELNDKIPFARCKKCLGDKVIKKDGKSIECPGPCLGLGFVTKFAYENAQKK
jgi:hypothetical protein